MPCLAGYKIAQCFKWVDYKKKTRPPTADARWPGTAHMPAEWLHRCAYSWGGLQGENPDTSQVPENLIFGTGECNSVMTRYEKAWQELIRREGGRLAAEKKRMASDEIASLGPGNLGGGLLHANINRGKIRPKFGMCTKDDGSDEAEVEPMAEEDQKKDLPPWLCYGLNYELYLNHTAEPLGKSEFKTVFYPWQRGFFTKFEQTLDEIVLERTYSSYRPSTEPKPSLRLDSLLDKRPSGNPTDPDENEAAIKKGDQGEIEEESKGNPNKKLHRDSQSQDGAVDTQKCMATLGVCNPTTRSRRKATTPFHKSSAWKARPSTSTLS